VTFDVWLFTVFLIDMCDDVLCKYISQYAIVCKVNNVLF
jgi:hypothetical protein